MAAPMMAVREASEEASQHKVMALAPSPAISCVSTIALSDVDGPYSSDDDDSGDMSPEERRWCVVGSRLAPVFASLLHRGADSPVCKPEPEIASSWEVTVDDPVEEARSEGYVRCSIPTHSGDDVEVRSWQLVGHRLADVFSTLRCDGDSTPRGATGISRVSVLE